MPDDRTNSCSRESKMKPDTLEIFSPQQGLRPGNQYLTEVADGDGDYCVMLCTLPRGVVVPMHSHADRETFYVVSGNPDAFRSDHWETLGPGDVLGFGLIFWRPPGQPASEIFLRIARRVSEAPDWLPPVVLHKTAHQRRNTKQTTTISGCWAPLRHADRS